MPDEERLQQPENTARLREVKKLFDRSLFSSGVACEEQKQRAYVIPYGWGWFSSGMPDEKFDEQLVPTGVLEVRMDRRWVRGCLWATPFPTDHNGNPNWIGSNGKEIVILAPSDYFLTPPGDTVRFDMHTQFPVGLRFTYIAHEPLTFDFGKPYLRDSDTKTSTIDRHYVVPQGYEKRYCESIGIQAGVRELPAKTIQVAGGII